MPAPSSSSLLLLFTVAASLPARLSAAWSAFTAYDAGAGQAQPIEPEATAVATTQDAPTELADTFTVEPLPVEPLHEAQVMAANIQENLDWLVALDSPAWRRAPWRFKLNTFLAAAARGAIITSAVTGRIIPRDHETVTSALRLLSHEMRQPEHATHLGGYEAETELPN